MHTHLTMAGTALKLQDGSIDAVDLVSTAIRKSRAARGVFISFIEWAHDDAVKSAHRRRSGAPLGRLDGIPFAVKDMIDVAGSRTTAGSITRIDSRPASRNAAVITAMRAIGMIPVGKTNLSEFAFSGLGLNPHFGTPTADFHAAAPRAPGGSSSGSAIAVQRGLVTAAIGTDTAGSIRVPAAFNGLVGFRASTGRYDMDGVHPLAVTLDSLGPLTRTVEDCVLLDSAMRGRANPDVCATPLEQVRFVVDSSVLEDPTLQPDVARNVRSVVTRLRERGARVEERPVEAFKRTRQAIATQGWLGAIEAWSLLQQVVEGERGDQIDRRVRNRLLAAKGIDRHAEARIRTLRAELMLNMLHELGDAVLVTPAVKHVAPSLAALEADDSLFAATNLETLSLTMPGSLLDMPGVAMPSGVDREGLPTSVLFSVQQGHDDRLLCACLAVESTLMSRPTE
ncbi:Asp-tRNAAsn/Glu-tRNAGln amidotransferase A subunit-related amidase [Paraburkholderia piptadeniae]|uniref:Asp-tRNAAsn/Glu-tRNAGln amidotransferase A subunit-related amidase n=2 Tax=Paraburkholderia piptadeniae TaxID=1701573 RepID=A0A1N7SDX4_9BURK|nr:Asp-tRNAAsn/Glu-tRNAGln amidotransferase A subunit-related amidase [Paraburkholderia piptadeniae]